MRIYLAGRITGVADYKERFAEAELLMRGWAPEGVVMNPAKLPAGKSEQWYMERCTKMVFMADVVVMLRGWDEDDVSAARIEWAVAKYCGKRVVLL